MAILLTGVDMPEEGKKICMSLVVHHNGTVTMFNGIEMAGMKAVGVPREHGRLIDADALEASCFMGSSSFYTQSDIDYAPTIIPVSEGQEDE